jgi:hypothetical protein
LYAVPAATLSRCAQHQTPGRSTATPGSGRRPLLFRLHVVVRCHTSRYVWTRIVLSSVSATGKRVVRTNNASPSTFPSPPFICRRHNTSARRSLHRTCPSSTLRTSPPERGTVISLTVSRRARRRWTSQSRAYGEHKKYVYFSHGAAISDVNASRNVNAPLSLPRVSLTRFSRTRLGRSRDQAVFPRTFHALRVRGRRDDRGSLFTRAFTHRRDEYVARFSPSKPSFSHVNVHVTAHNKHARTHGRRRFTASYPAPPYFSLPHRCPPRAEQQPWSIHHRPPPPRFASAAATDPPPYHALSRGPLSDQGQPSARHPSARFVRAHSRTLRRRVFISFPGSRPKTFDVITINRYFSAPPPFHAFLCAHIYRR